MMMMFVSTVTVADFKPIDEKELQRCRTHNRTELMNLACLRKGNQSVLRSDRSKVSGNMKGQIDSFLWWIWAKWLAESWEEDGKGVLLSAYTVCSQSDVTYIRCEMENKKRVHSWHNHFLLAALLFLLSPISWNTEEYFYFSGKQCEILTFLDFSMKKACQRTSCLFNQATSGDAGRFSF